MKFIDNFRSAFLDTERRALLYILLVISAGVNIYLITPPIFQNSKNFQPGSIVTEDIIVPKDTYIADPAATELKIEDRISSAPVILDFDPSIVEKKIALVEEIFGQFRETFEGLDQNIFQSSENIKDIETKIFDYSAWIQKDRESLGFQQGYQEQIQKMVRREERAKKSSSLFLRKFGQEIQAGKLAIAVLKKEIDENEELLSQASKQLEGLKKNYQSFLQQRKEKTNQLIEKLQTNLTISIKPEKQSLFYNPFYRKETEEQLKEILRKVSAAPLLEYGELSNIDLNRKAKINNILTEKTQNVERISELLSLRQTREEISRIIQNEPLPKKVEPYREVLLMFAEKLISPSVTLNRAATEKILIEIKENTAPVYVNLKKGETLARRGEKITPSKNKLLNEYFDSGSFSNHTLRFFGIAVLVLLIFGITAKVLSQRSRAYDEERKNILIIFFSITLTLMICKAWLVLAESFQVSYPNFQVESFYFALPAALAALLVGILIKFSSGIFTGLVTGTFVSLMLNDNLYLFLFIAGGSAIASFPIANKDSRIGLVKHGLVISGVNMIITLQIFFLQSDSFDQKLFYELAAAFTSGIIASFFALFLLPFFEYIFDITTDLKLLELSNMNHPALKQLMNSAPGSYQHSIMVGSLAEAAALKVNANSLFCRVASYYHDIGKSKHPEYFIENADVHTKNVHDEINDPYRSAGLIIDHVKDGREMAKEYKLGKKIGQIIQQHHGTSLMKFFYIRAKNSAPESQKTYKKDFRYPGPKPQNLESAIIMLADSCEAAVRSIQNPTPAKIDEMIRKVSGGILQDGQLDQSGISLKQFKDVMETFLDLLITIYHQRIEYPEDRKKTPRLAGLKIPQAPLS